MYFYKLLSGSTDNKYNSNKTGLFSRLFTASWFCLLLMSCFFTPANAGRISVDVVNGQGVFRDEAGSLISLRGVNFIRLGDVVNAQEDLVSGYHVLFDPGAYSSLDAQRVSLT